MNTLRFKTNINCGGCIKAVTPTLNQVAGQGNWQVDTSVPDKTLTVQANSTTAQQVLEAVQEAGFEIQQA
ncbi:heavy-metal-associated domain-containing protein [Solirubrum puertoriconensis]|uniref:HMA domain-containing protein n=1 Tax=Solirubrum puertoriconensis TaxID=1751427 RepID=A0A9X0HP39_SOLP1|nr:heavy-metal-associated domain-containing protein [Solirubrum puertoriconensis]KUG09630.1 hypothetical protein ASU33_18225 [Solirubrum puertoriconensis]